MLSNKILDVLKIFYQIVEGENIFWILSGSTSLAIQGVDIIVNDIDILTDERGARQINILLADKIIKESTHSSTEKYRSFFGVYKINDVKIDVMGEFQYRLKDGLWSQPNQLHKIFIKEYEEMSLPVLSLEQELIEYQNLGKENTVKRIRAALG